MEIADEELENILNSAIAEFEEEEELGSANDSDEAGAGVDLSSGDKGPKRIDKALGDKMREGAALNMDKLIDDLNNPAFKDTLEDTLKVLSGNSHGHETIEEYLKAAQKENPTDANDLEIDRGVAQTLELMSRASNDMEGMETAQVEASGEEMMNKMMGEFEKLGEKEDFNQVIDGMMRQLLSRDLMYEPMKAVCEKYPEWLAEKQDQLSKDDYLRFGTQYQFFQRIVAVYETEPDNFPRLMELMQDVQQYGQPPAEIIKELAPGLEFNSEGMPIMPNMGPNAFPSMSPGMPGIPLPDPDGQQCAIM